MKRRQSIGIGAAVLVAVLALGGLGILRWRNPRPVLRLVYRVEDPRQAGRVVEVVGRRVAARARGAVVALCPSPRLCVDLPSLSAADLDALRRALALRVDLALRLVDDRSDLFQRVVAAGPLPPGIQSRAAAGDGPRVSISSGNRERLEAFVRSLPSALRPPADRDLVLGEGLAPTGRATVFELYLLERERLLDGSAIAQAEVVLDPGAGRPEVALTLTSSGAARFEEITRAAVGRRLAILLDGEVSTAPRVMAPISGGRVRISLGGQRDAQALLLEARDLAAALEAGGLPSRLTLLSQAVIAR